MVLVHRSTRARCSKSVDWVTHCPLKLQRLILTHHPRRMAVAAGVVLVLLPKLSPSTRSSLRVQRQPYRMRRQLRAMCLRARGEANQQCIGRPMTCTRPLQRCHLQEGSILPHPQAVVCTTQSQ